MSRNQLIADRYEVQASLGEGGMGEVVKAHDSLLGITVAIKRLHQENRSETILRFQTEAVALAKLNHRNIVKIFDFARDGNTTYMVMEFLDGVSLAHYIKRNQMSVVEALEVLVDVCAALAHAHKNGVLHRDLKPSNIMLVSDDQGVGYAKVVDFGIARLEQREQGITGTGVGIGSPSYMSPEQITNTDVDTRADIYSFGCVMFETLRGFPPIKGETAMDTAQKHLNETAPLLSHGWQGQAFPTGLIDVVSKCLRKNPDERFQSFAELQRTLTELLEQLISEGDDTEDTTLEKAKEEDGIVPGARTTKQKMFVPAVALTVLIVVGALSFLIQDGFQVKTKERDASPIRANQISTMSPTEMGGAVEKLRIVRDFEDRSGLSEWEQSDRVLPARPEMKLSNNDRDCLVERTSAGDMNVLARNLRGKLNELIIKNSHIDTGMMSSIASLNLTSLHIEDCSMDAEALKGITQLTTLVSLWLVKCDDVRDSDLAALSNLTNLRAIKLGTLRHVSKGGITALSRIGSLESLLLDSARIDDSCMPVLNKLPNLAQIGLTKNNTISESGLVSLINGKKLNSFSYAPCGPCELQGDNLITALAQSGASAITLEDISMTSDQLVKLCANKKINNLKVEIPIINPMALVALSSLPNLQLLRITNTQNFTVGYMKQLSKCQHLADLGFFGCNVTNDQLKPLENMTALRKVDADKCLTTLEAVDNLNKQLQK